jgi:hypothetical protein
MHKSPAMVSARLTISAAGKAGVVVQRPRRGLRVSATRADGHNAVFRFEHIAGAGDDQRRRRVGYRQHRLEPPQDAIRTPVLRQLDGSSRQVALMLFELGLESLEQRERVGSRPGKTGQYLLVIKPAHLARRRLDDDIAQRDLAIAAERDRALAADRQDGGAVK